MKLLACRPELTDNGGACGAGTAQFSLEKWAACMVI
jgi:hypothetical protein